MLYKKIYLRENPIENSYITTYILDDVVDAKEAGSFGKI